MKGLVELDFVRYAPWKFAVFVSLFPRRDAWPGELRCRISLFSGFDVLSNRWRWLDCRIWPAWLDEPSVETEYKRTMRR